MPSPADQAVLDAVFENLTSAADGRLATSELLDFAGDANTHLNLSPDDENEFESQLLQKVKQLEVQGVRAAESGDLIQALVLFDEAVELLPDRASGYNNRAQALRLLGQNDRAMDDLNKAISLKETSCSGRVNALCQRALLFLLQGSQEKAMADLRAAASAGNSFAKRALVNLNPYSALCNQMLHQMLQMLTRCSDDASV